MSNRKQGLSGYATGAIVAFVFFGFYLLGIFSRFELQTLDSRFQLRKELTPNKNIVLLEIDDTSLQFLGKWPIPRDVHASLLYILSKYKPKTIGYDILFSEPSSTDPEADELLSQQLKICGNVYLASFTQDILSPQDVTEPIPLFLSAAKGSSLTNVYIDEDGITRRVPVAIFYKGMLKPSLSLSVVCDYLGVNTKDVKFFKNRVDIPAKDRTIKIPLDTKGFLIVNYICKPDKFKRISLAQLIESDNMLEQGLKPAIPLEGIKDKIVLIGLTATGTVDLRPTPLSSSYPGLAVHASVIDNMLNGRFIRQAPWFAVLLILLILCIVTGGIVPKISPVKGFLIAAGAVVLYLFGAFILFTKFGIWLDIFHTTIAVIISYLFIVLGEFINERFQKKLIEKELDIAADIQRSILPHVIPAIPGLEIAVKNIAAKHVGGDFYDFVDFGANRIGIVIGDVSGKGVPAALYMAKTTSDFRLMAKAASSPGEVLFKLNQVLSTEGASGMFITLLYFILEMDKKKILMSNAAHFKILRARKDSVEAIGSESSPPLGILPDTEFSTETADFKNGDILFIYTDGLIEARNKKGAEFGEEKLKEILLKRKDSSAGKIMDAVISEVLSFAKGAPQHDDITVLALKIL